MTSRASISVEVNTEEAKKALKDLERELERVEKAGDEAQGSLGGVGRAGRGGTRLSGRGNASARNRSFQKEGGQDLKALAANVTAILAIAKTLQVATNAVAQKLEKIPGLGGASRSFQTASDELTRVGSVGAKFQGLAGAAGITNDFARAGMPLNQEQMTKLVSQKVSEAERDAARRERAAARGMGAGFDTFRRFLGMGG